MVKAKKSETPAPTPTPKVKKAASKKKTEEKPAPATRKYRRSRTLSNRIFLKRVCKQNSLQTPNGDAYDMADGAYNALLRNFLTHLKLVVGTKKTVTRKAVRLAFIGYMDSVGASDEIVQGALARADMALQALYPGLE